MKMAGRGRVVRPKKPIEPNDSPAVCCSSICTHLENLGLQNAFSAQLLEHK